MLFKPKHLFFWLIAGSLLIAGTGYSKSSTERITARFANIKLIVNDQVIQTKAEPFIYNGNVYAPVATVANMLGIKQEWDNKTPAVRFSDPDAKTYDADARVFDTPIGSGLHLLTEKTTHGVYIIEDRLHNVRVPIPTPKEAIGHPTISTPSSSLIALTSPQKQDFVMVQINLDNNDKYLQVLHYENKQLTVAAEVKIEIDPSLRYVDVSVSENTNLIYVNISDEHNVLKEVLVYKWDNGKLVKTGNVKS